MLQIVAKNKESYFYKPLIKGVFFLTNLILKGYIGFRKIKWYYKEREQGAICMGQTPSRPILCALALLSKNQLKK
jgi:hypothetical protein